MKKAPLFTLTTAILLTTSLGFAAPLTDYSTGKTSIDVMWRSADMTATKDGEVGAMNKKPSMEWGITTGLGNNFAVQYIDSNAKAKETVVYNGYYDGLGQVTSYMSGKLKTQEFNILYKLNNNIAAFTGLVRLKSTLNEHGTMENYGPYEEYHSSNTENRIQFGLIGNTKLADKTTAYASMGVASHLLNWKIGVSQEIAPNLEFNVDYRKINAKKIKFSDEGNADIKMKGAFGWGLSYKF